MDKIDRFLARTSVSLLLLATGVLIGTECSKKDSFLTHTQKSSIGKSIAYFNDLMRYYNIMPRKILEEINDMNGKRKSVRYEWLCGFRVLTERELELYSIDEGDAERCYNYMWERRIRQLPKQSQPPRPPQEKIQSRQDIA